MISQWAFTQGQLQLSITGPGPFCEIQTSTNLVDWTSLQTNTVPGQLTDPDAARFKQRFYRALVAP